MIEIPFVPSQDGYGATLNDGTYGARTAGGPARSRRSVLGSISEVDVEWKLSLDKYSRLMFMIDHQLAGGTIPFLIPLILDDGELKNYTAEIEPKSLELDDTEGFTVTVGCTLLVQRPPAPQVVRAYAAISGETGYLLPGAVKRITSQIGAAELRGSA